MDPDLSRDDHALMAALREALATGHHPREELVVANAQDAFTFADLEAELAGLVFDSLLPADAGPAERDGTATRMIVFESEALSMELEFVGDTVVGQIAPGGRRRVTVETPDGVAAEVTTDELGCFSLPAPANGPLRFRIVRDGSTTVTEWTHADPDATA